MSNHLGNIPGLFSMRTALADAPYLDFSSMRQGKYQDQASSVIVAFTQGSTLHGSRSRLVQRFENSDMCGDAVHEGNQLSIHVVSRPPNVAPIYSARVANLAGTSQPIEVDELAIPFIFITSGL
ncbi:hypothetical protein BDN71DRAFT_991640 [Pleurotus eryngii]|uniref:Uncharacterized protein n=1 Tax=Pleurotus eryngii TaxID=5323 RepID=A0A9P5ZVI3_PLEER|nr:hypothetical protein BDN71DRAFT_991640 [Pleurotus eryngii]